MNIFGYEISKKVQDPDDLKPQVSFIPKEDDGATVVSQAGAMGQYVDLDGTIQSDSELITRYRTMAEHPALAQAITSIVNEAIINEPEDDTVGINLDTVESIPEGTKTKIVDEFKNVLRLFNFDLEGYEIFKRWYIDGRLYYHVIVDPKKLGDGISELRYIDPRKIRKIREVKKAPMQNRPGVGNGPDAGDLIEPQKEFYIFNDAGFTKDDISSIPNQGIATGMMKISKDAIVHITSGQMDVRGKSVVSYLHKAIRPLNMLTMLEDSSVIYRLSRAPERRVFYIDTSGMPRAKAEQYLKQTMTNFKNKVVYDSSTGQVKDQRKFMTMFEDFYLARRDGGKGTEIQTLPAGQNLGEIEDIVYFQKRLYQALEVPSSRLDPDAMYSLGHATEISRDEVGFEKFVTRLRARFSQLLLNTLRVQLLLKNIIKPEDWERFKNEILFTYAKDNLFAELKDNEVMMGRIGVAVQLIPFIGRYFSEEWVRKTIFKQTEEDQKEQDNKIVGEKGMEQYSTPLGAPPADPNAMDPSQDDLAASQGQEQ